VLPRGERTYVGRNDSGIEVSLPAAPRILNAMNGRVSCQEMSENLNIPLADLTSLLLELDQAQLLDLEETKISVHTRFHSPNPHRSSHIGDDSSDGAYQQLQYRLSPELSFTTWLGNVKDGGVSLISARRNCEVTIFGDSRIAILLYGILLSSGISQTTLITNRESSTIADQDLCAGYLRARDVGLCLKTRVDELKRELSLFPITPSPISGAEIVTKKIRVAVGAPPADELQQWMSDGIPHFLLEDPDCASINIGPLVLPGRTPCWRCISLAKEDQNFLWREIQRQRMESQPTEVPVAVAHHVAGLAGLELLRFIDSGQSQLIGAMMRVDYHAPGDSETTLFTRHPACGCTW
jgi:hypothetical protein